MKWNLTAILTGSLLAATLLAEPPRAVPIQEEPKHALKLENEWK